MKSEICTLIVATTSYAGMGPYVTSIINSFSEDENRFFLFRDYEDDYFLKNVKSELHIKSKFYKKENSSWNKLTEMFFGDRNFDDIVCEICEKNNINVVHYINRPVPRRMVDKLNKIGIKTVGTIHDLHPHEAKKSFYKMLRARITSQNMMLDLQENNLLITNGEEQFDELHKLYPTKTVFFHSFPSLVSDAIAEGKECPPELNGLNNPYILFFGRIEEYKGLKLLYDAFLSSKILNDNFSLVIAGSGDISFTRKSNEEKVVWIHRYIKDTEVRALYENAKCVVYPYISATQSGVLSLSFFFKTPTIVSDVPFFRCIMDSSSGGLVFENGNLKDLQCKMEKILFSDTDDYREKQEKYYKENYNSSAIHDKLNEIYSEIGRTFC